jgi:putative transposase
LLREIDVLTANGKSLLEACKAAGISDKSYYRWRKQYGGLKVDQARRFKDLEAENTRLKRLVADLSLDKAMLKEVAAGNF